MEAHLGGLKTAAPAWGLAAAAAAAGQGYRPTRYSDKRAATSQMTVGDAEALCPLPPSCLAFAGRSTLTVSGAQHHDMRVANVRREAACLRSRCCQSVRLPRSKPPCLLLILCRPAGCHCDP